MTTSDDKYSSNIEQRIQDELCKLTSSRFDGISLPEITPFMAVMRMLKIEYGDCKPEVYKMLIAVLQDYNPYLGNPHYEKTVKYVNILLANQPELAEYLVSIIPKPEDFDGNKKTRKEAVSTVPLCNAEELLKHSLHVIGSKGKGFDLRLPTSSNIRLNQNNDDTNTKILRLFNFNPSTEGAANRLPTTAQQRWTIKASSSSAQSEGAATVVIKTEPMPDSGRYTTSNTEASSEIGKTLVTSQKPTVHDLIREKLQAMQGKNHGELSRSTQPHYIQVKKEPSDQSDVKQRETYDGSNKTNRPVILRKPDLPRPFAAEKLPTAKVDNRKTMIGNQSFPYTQQVVFSDGTKQNFVFNAKANISNQNQNDANAVIVPFSHSNFVPMGSENGNPLVCLQQMVSKTESTTTMPSKTNVVVLQGRKVTTVNAADQKEEISKPNANVHFHVNPDVAKPQTTAGPIDLSAVTMKQKRKRRVTDRV